MIQTNHGYNGFAANEGMQGCRSCASKMTNQNQQQLMDWINQISFALNDVVLYLDTHPCDQEAMAYFQHFHKKRQEALEEYGRRFSPLTLDSISNCQDQWEWVHDKWPWEGGNC